MEIKSVPGFGFYTEQFWNEVENQSGNFSDSDICDLLGTFWDHGIRDPSHAPGEESSTCRPIWDTITCIPGTRAGQTAVSPCLSKYKDTDLIATNNITRRCLENGTWVLKTDYQACYPEDEGNDDDIQEDLIIFYFGYSISTISLVVAISIFLYFREMRCLRHKIHLNLFISLLLSMLLWILVHVLGTLGVHNIENRTLVATWCGIKIPHRYFYLSTFYWMFVEGLYLFLQVEGNLTFGSIKLRHCLGIGWGVPFVIMFIWTTLVLCEGSTIHVQDADISNKYNSSLFFTCPYDQPDKTIELVTYYAPVFLVLACNLVFLVWIMAVVIAKLRLSQNTTVNTHFHLRALKALLVIVPLLGITYLITLVGPEKGDNIWSNIYLGVRNLLLAFQGFFITLPYCFLNTEVCHTIKNRFERWRSTRDIVTGAHSARNSVVTTHFIDNGNNANRARQNNHHVDNIRSLHVRTEPVPRSVHPVVHETNQFVLHNSSNRHAAHT